MTVIETIVACSRWANDMPPVVGCSNGNTAVEHIDGECPRHGGSDCLAVYRIERGAER